MCAHALFVFGFLVDIAVVVHAVAVLLFIFLDRIHLPPLTPPPPPLSRSASFDDKTWSNVYNHDAYMANRAVSADIMEPSHASSQVPATSVKKRLFDTVVEMSEVYARAPVGITLTLLHVCT